MLYEYNFGSYWIHSLNNHNHTLHWILKDALIFRYMNNAEKLLYRSRPCYMISRRLALLPGPSQPSRLSPPGGFLRDPRSSRSTSAAGTGRWSSNCRNAISGRGSRGSSSGLLLRCLQRHHHYRETTTKTTIIKLTQHEIEVIISQRNMDFIIITAINLSMVYMIQMQNQNKTAHKQHWEAF